MESKKAGRIVIDEAEARKQLLNGAAESAKAVGSSYGPRGLNTIIENSIGRPTITRDGVTIARQVYFSDADKNLGSQLVMEASNTTNRTAGDATSATVLLTNNLMKRGVQAIAAGLHPIVVSEQIKANSEKLLAKLDDLTLPAYSKPGDLSRLKAVATVSSGDPLLGQLIAEAVDYVGPDGGLMPEPSMAEAIEREYVTGYFLQSGFLALSSGRRELVSPAVVISTRRIVSAADANELLSKTAKAMGITPQSLQQGNIPRIAFIGNIEGEAQNFLVNNANKGVIDCVVVKPPAQFGEMARYLLEDIALYVGCRPITESTILSALNEDYVGQADRVIASRNETNIFRDDSTDATGTELKVKKERQEQIKQRMADLRTMLVDEQSDHIAEKVRDRIAKLEGKIAIFRIGGATETEKEELAYRVDDGILATRAAASGGVVVGGGVTWVALSREDISGLYREAILDLVRLLFKNANLDPELYLDKLKSAKKNEGFNLRKTDGLVNLLDDGILDAAPAIRQTIINATSIACKMIAVGNMLVAETKD